MQTKVRRSLLWLFLSLALLVISWPVISTHPDVGPDNEALIAPMRSVHSFADYTTAIRENKILDLQPVRDFSYWMESEIKELTGFENQQLVNLILWLATLILLSSILAQAEVTDSIRFIVVFFVALHPVMTSCLFWKASRKHILSAFFILAATYFLKKTERSRRLLLASFACFALSLFSQPINIGFPFFATAWIYKNRKNTRNAAFLTYSVSIFLIGSAVAWLNLSYYQSESYINSTYVNNPKFRGENLTSIVNRFLIWGRDAFQLLLPIKPAVSSYNLQSYCSTAGLLLVLLIFIILRRKRWLCKYPWEWLLFAILPIGTMTLKLTSQGAYDTYLLTPLLGFGIGLGVFLNRICIDQKAPVRFIATATAFMLLSFCFIDLRSSVIWASEPSFYLYGYKSETSKANRVAFATYLLNHAPSNTNEVLAITDPVLSEDPKFGGLGYVYGKAIYLMQVSTAEKAKLYARYAIDDPWFTYYQSAFEAQHGFYESAASRLESEWFKNPRHFFSEFVSNSQDLESKWERMCQLALKPDCRSIHFAIQEQREKFAKARRF